MPFASINSTNPRTNPWNFGVICSAFGGGWKTQVFLSRPFWKKFAKKNFFFLLHSYENMSKFIGLQGFFKILMITLVSSPKQHLPKHIQHSVLVYNSHVSISAKNVSGAEFNTKPFKLFSRYFNILKIFYVYENLF